LWPATSKFTPIVSKRASPIGRNLPSGFRDALILSAWPLPRAREWGTEAAAMLVCLLKGRQPIASASPSARFTKKRVPARVSVSSQKNHCFGVILSEMGPPQPLGLGTGGCLPPLGGLARQQQNVTKARIGERFQAYRVRSVVRDGRLRAIIGRRFHPRRLLRKPPHPPQSQHSLRRVWRLLRLLRLFPRQAHSVPRHLQNQSGENLSGCRCRS
jgi:hypothetical protein